MQIICFHSADAPPSKAWLARYMDGNGFLPVVHHAATEEAVRRTAQSFWDEQQALAERKRGAALARKAAPPPFDLPQTTIDLEEAIAAAPVDDFDGLLG